MMMKHSEAWKAAALGLAAMAAFTLAGCGGSADKAASSKPQTQKESPLMQKIKKDTESGQFEKWVDQYSKIAVEKAK